MMNNRFDNITSKKRKISLPQQEVSQRETLKGKPKQSRVGREAYDTLMGLLALDTETPTTHHGVYIANSTKRNLRMQIEELFQP